MDKTVIIALYHLLLQQQAVKFLFDVLFI